MPYYQDKFLFDYEASRFEFSRYGFVRNGRGSKFTTFMVGTLLIRILIGKVLASSDVVMAELSKPIKSDKPKTGDTSKNKDDAKPMAMVNAELGKR